MGEDRTTKTCQKKIWTTMLMICFIVTSSLHGCIVTGDPSRRCQRIEHSCHQARHKLLALGARIPLLIRSTLALFAGEREYCASFPYPKGNSRLHDPCLSPAVAKRDVCAKTQGPSADTVGQKLR